MAMGLLITSKRIELESCAWSQMKAINSSFSISRSQIFYQKTDPREDKGSVSIGQQVGQNNQIGSSAYQSTYVDEANEIDTEFLLGAYAILPIKMIKMKVHTKIVGGVGSPMGVHKLFKMAKMPFPLLQIYLREN